MNFKLVTVSNTWKPLLFSYNQFYVVSMAEQGSADSLIQ